MVNYEFRDNSEWNRNQHDHSNDVKCEFCISSDQDCKNIFGYTEDDSYDEELEYTLDLTPMHVLWTLYQYII
ncbi:hypothetical protein GCM10009000_079110 [Halobacterium noricense]|uniref:Uncharacterized protein n=1 Tax=Haladaptatus pallidirubidus TaxID=1008152 RepID=A0AAV3UHP5_9EURY